MASSDPWRVPWPDRFGAFWMRTWPDLGPWLADLETRTITASESLPEVRAPVFIGGLARSGSTILLEQLARLPGFASHRYADFPMLWTPCWWGRLLDRLPKSKALPVERAHRDRILVTRDSPEAFEEPLWEQFFPTSKRETDVLDADCSHPQFERCFREHLAKLLLARGATRYLSKGNYNSLRIGYLAKLFPDARFLVPIRSPLAHVASLMRQDALYQDAPMTTLRQIEARGHYEFGPLKRAIRLASDAPRDAPALAGQLFWLQQWLAVYATVRLACLRDSGLAARTLLVPYESMAADPVAGFARIRSFLDLPDTPEVTDVLRQAAGAFAGSAHQVPQTLDDLSQKSLLDEALALFGACQREFDSSKYRLGTLGAEA